MTARPRALVVQPALRSLGGGDCVCAWALQALRDEYEVTLLAWQMEPLERINDAFGTDLRPADFRLRRMPRFWRFLLDRVPLPLALFKMGMIQKFARRLLAREDFDLVVSTANEIDVGRPALQYVHYPWAFYPRPDIDYRWYHPRILVRAYRGVTSRLFDLSLDRIARNPTLVNSNWTGQRYRAWYRARAHTLHPPAPVERPLVDWAQRADRFACVGRIAPEKRVLEIIDILAAVRARGHAVTLLVCGHADGHRYLGRLRAAIARHGDWITLALDLPRAAMLERLASCRFGIHGMAGEHFGIAVAELLRLGAVCFAPRDGGPAEILGDACLLYDSDAEAVEKICAALDDPARLAALRAWLAERAEGFSAERFMAGFRAACRALAARPAQRLDEAAE